MLCRKWSKKRSKSLKVSALLNQKKTTPKRTIDIQIKPQIALALFAQSLPVKVSFSKGIKLEIPFPVHIQTSLRTTSLLLPLSLQKWRKLLSLNTIFARYKSYKKFKSNFYVTFSAAKIYCIQMKTKKKLKWMLFSTYRRPWLPWDTANPGVQKHMWKLLNNRMPTSPNPLVTLSL